MSATFTEAGDVYAQAPPPRRRQALREILPAAGESSNNNDLMQLTVTLCVVILVVLLVVLGALVWHMSRRDTFYTQMLLAALHRAHDAR